MDVIKIRLACGLALVESRVGNPNLLFLIWGGGSVWLNILSTLSILSEPTGVRLQTQGRLASAGGEEALYKGFNHCARRIIAEVRPLRGRASV